jgi:hypothetical protein
MIGSELGFSKIFLLPDMIGRSAYLPFLRETYICLIV